MGAEMRDGEEIQMWRKAISEGRDRVQSRVLVWVVGAALVWAAFDALQVDYELWVIPIPFHHEYVLVSIGASVAFAVLVRALRAATTTASLFGGMICLTLMIYGGPPSVDALTLTGAEPLAMLFLLTFVSTRLRRRKKAAAGLAEGRKGRNAAQVIANLSVAALVLSPVGLVIVGEFLSLGGEYLPHHTIEFIRVMCLAALVEATADTVSSEIGQAFGGRPVMVSSLRRVEVGTDGAVSLLGSGAGILAAAMVVGVGMWALRLNVVEACVAFVAGICGLFFDSFLGATVERRGWLGNDLVNFASTVFAAGVAALMYRVVVFGW